VGGDLAIDSGEQPMWSSCSTPAARARAKVAARSLLIDA